MTAPFFCDLDGDGEEEQYCFAVADTWPGEEGIRVSQRGRRGYARDEQITEYYLPLICRERADGTYEAVPELADLLEDPAITLYYLGEQPEALISAVQLPGRRFGVWAGEVEAQATSACAGGWDRAGPRDGRRAAGRGRHAEGNLSAGRIKRLY